MKAKYINENHVKVLNNRFIEEDGIIYTNPLNNPDVDLLACGYKDIVNGEIPTYNEDTQELVGTYEETANEIIVHYSVIEKGE